MKRLLILPAVLLTASPSFACDRIFGKYNQAKTVDFCLHVTDATVGAVKLETAAHASGDTYIMKDEGAEANTTNAFTDEGSCYSIVLTATEMQAARVTLNIEDQSTKTWADKCIVIETYGNASAEHAFDLDTATVAIGASGITDASFSLAQLTAESGTTLTLAASAVAADDQFNTGFALNVYDYTTKGIKASACITDSTNTGETVVTSVDISGTIVGAGGSADYYAIVGDPTCRQVPESTTVPTTGTLGVIEQLRAIYQLLNAKFDSTSSEQRWYRNDGSTVWTTKDISDNGTTYSRTASETDD